MNASNSLDTLNAGMSTPNHFVMWNTEGIAVLVCSTLTIYNALELVLLILTTFQAYVGIYFWSLIFATMGLIPYTLGFMTEYFQWSYLALGIGIDTFGWILMVSGQSVVLYSRLHILFHQGGYKRLLTCIKMMIIINAVIMHVTTCVVVYGSHFGLMTNTFGAAYNIVERIQMCAFCVQELILSSLYIWRTVDILRSTDGKRASRIMWQICIVNIIIILLDAALLVAEFSGQHILQQTSKGVIYSIKLKLEFSTLTKLVEISQASSMRLLASSFAGNGWNMVPDYSTELETFHPTDLEKSSLQQPESVYLPTYNTNSQARRTNTDPLVAAALPEPNLDMILPVSRANRNISETSLLYAEIMRKVAV